MRNLATMAFAALALAACSDAAQPEADSTAAGETVAPAAAGPDIDAAVIAYFEPFMRAYATGDPAAWERPIYSAGLTEEIDRWEASLVDGELGELQDFDWLCECQDWDHTTFKPTIASHDPPAGNAATVDIDLAIGWGDTRKVEYRLALENGAWLIDDIRSESFPQGLRAALATATERNAEAAT